MAAKTKTFDCVELKNRIQAELLAEKARLGEAETERRHREWLAESTDPLAAWWRSVAPPRATATAPDARRETNG
jgi:hypothetical protein